MILISVYVFSQWIILIKWFSTLKCNMSIYIPTTMKIKYSQLIFDLKSGSTSFLQVDKWTSRVLNLVCCYTTLHCKSRYGIRPAYITNDFIVFKLRRILCTSINFCWHTWVPPLSAQTYIFVCMCVFSRGVLHHKVTGKQNVTVQFLSYTYFLYKLHAAIWYIMKYVFTLELFETTR